MNLTQEDLVVDQVEATVKITGHPAFAKALTAGGFATRKMLRKLEKQGKLVRVDVMTFEGKLIAYHTPRTLRAAYEAAQSKENEQTEG